MLKGILGYDSKIGGILTKGIDYICLILLWVAFSLPVITAGASTCAFFMPIIKPYFTITDTYGSLFGNHLR